MATKVKITKPIWPVQAANPSNGRLPLTAAIYVVYAKWTEHSNRATNATDLISHADGTTDITVNQQTNGGQWNPLGTFTLDTQSTIQLSDQANGYVIADALKLVPTQASSTTTAWTLNYIHADHLELAAE